MYNFCFGPHGEILTYPTVRPTADNREPDVHPPRSPVSEIHEHFEHLPSPVVDLLYASHQTFRELDEDVRKFVQESDRKMLFDKQCTPAVLHASKEYREQMNSCKEKLWSLADRIDTDGMDALVIPLDHHFSAENLNDFADLLRFSISFMWLCELMFMGTPEFLLARSFADWANQFGEIVGEEMFEKAQGWEKLHGLLLEGQLSAARDLIAQVLLPVETQRSDPDLRWAAETLLELIAKVPHEYAVEEEAGGFVQRTYNSKWATWKIKVRHAQDALFERGLSGAQKKGVETALGIMGGDLPALEGACFTRIAAILRWSQPTATVEQFVQILTEEIEKENPTLGHMANVFRCLLDIHNHEHLVKSIKCFDEVMCCATQFCFPWATAHIVDLLTRSFQYETARNMASSARFDPARLLLESNIPNMIGSSGRFLPYGSNLREHYLFAYADSVGAHGEEHIAAQYLKRLPCQIQQRQPTINALYSHMSLASDRDARKLLAACQRASGKDHFAMVPTEEAICAARAAHWVSRGRYAQSMQWATKTTNPLHTTRICEKIVEDCLKNDADFSALDAVVDDIGAGERLSPHILFLTRYKELDLPTLLADLQTLASNTQSFLDRSMFARLVKSGQQITKLMATNLALDEKVWRRCLRALRPMLDLKPPVVGVDDTFSLMRSLEWLEASHKKKKYLVELLPKWEIVKVHLHASMKKAGADFPLTAELYLGFKNVISCLPHWDTETLGRTIRSWEALGAVYERKKQDAEDEHLFYVKLLNETRVALANNLANAMIQPPH